MWKMFKNPLKIYFETDAFENILLEGNTVKLGYNELGY